MKRPDLACHCCGRMVSYEQFKPGKFVCLLCASMDVYDAVAMTKSTIERLNAQQRESARARKETRISAKLQRYAIEGKRCTSCHHYKRPEDYNKCAPQPDGLQPICRDCNKARVTLLPLGGLKLWHQTRDALRATAKGPLNQN